MPKYKKQAANDGFLFPVTKPDLSNYVKQIEDCLTTMKFWRDDSQVVKLEPVKKYSDSPCWDITLIELDNEVKR